MALGLTGVNNNIFARANELISGIELEAVSKEIFTSAPTNTSAVSNLSDSKILFGNNSGITLFGVNASVNADTAKLIATNTANYNVQLSQEALSAIQALKAQAAKANVTSVMDGRININNQQPQVSDFKSVFLPSNAPEVFETTSLTKDKNRGGGGNSVFSGLNRKREKEQNDSLYIFA